MYAIIRDRGMQYRVEEGQVLEIARLDAEPGSQIELAEVLLIGGVESMQVGAPLISGAKVLAQVVDEIKGDKIVVFRYKNKKRYRRRTGHRQQYTRIAIGQILGKDGQRLARSEEPAEERDALAEAPEPATAALTAAAPTTALATDEPATTPAHPAEAGSTTAPATDESSVTLAQPAEVAATSTSATDEPAATPAQPAEAGSTTAPATDAPAATPVEPTD